MFRYIFFLFFFPLSFSSVAQGPNYADSCEAGQRYTFDRNYKEAVTAYTFCLLTKNDDLSKGYISLQIGYAYSKLKDYKKAQQYYSSSAANFASAKSVFVTSNKPAEIEAVNNYEALLYRQIGECNCDEGKYEIAISNFDKALDLIKRKDTLTYISKAVCFRKQGNFYEASSLLDYLQKQNSNSYKSMILTERGILEFERKNLALAEQYFMNAITLPLAYSEPFYQLGLISMKSGNFREGINHFTKAISFPGAHPKNFVKRAEAYAWLNFLDSARADLKSAANKFADADEISKASLIIRKQELPRLTPEIPKSTNNEFVKVYQRANQLKKEGKPGDAFKEISKAIRLDPNNSDAYVLSGEIGLILFEINHPDAMGDSKFNFEKNDYWWLVVNDLTHAIEINPANAPAFYFRGAAYLLAKKKKEAIKDLENAALLKPGDAQITEALKYAKEK